MPDSDNETFDLDDRQAEIVPALQKTNIGNFFVLHVEVLVFSYKFKQNKTKHNVCLLKL